MTRTLSEIERAQLAEKGVAAHENFEGMRQGVTNVFTDAIKRAMDAAEKYRAEAVVQAGSESELAKQEAAQIGVHASKAGIIAQRTEQRAQAAHVAKQRDLVNKLAADLTPGAILQLAAIAANPNEAGAVRVNAIEKISDRGIGKATIPMTVTRDDLYKMPIMEALELLGEMASSGGMTVEEINAHQRLLETRVKVMELEQLTTRMNDLEAMLIGNKTVNGVATRVS